MNDKKPVENSEMRWFTLSFYHNWIYEYVLNTSWFLWVFVVLVLVVNFLGPVILWIIMSGKYPSNKHKKKHSHKR